MLNIKTKCLFVLTALISTALFAQNTSTSQSTLPTVWATYQKVVNYETDFADMKAHGVSLINMGARDVADAREKLKLARATGMKYYIGFPDITESAGMVRSAGLEPVNALMIGGVYQGKGIDRHLFHTIPSIHQTGFQKLRG